MDKSGKIMKINLQFSLFCDILILCEQEKDFFMSSRITAPEIGFKKIIFFLFADPLWGLFFLESRSHGLD